MSQKPAHFYKQSAVIPYRIKDGQLEILLVTSRKARRWVLPKGIHEPDLSAAESAAKEALEEAGVEGHTSEQPVGHYSYEKWGGVCFVEIFPMRVETVHSEWQESYRDRVWVTASEAAILVEEPDLKNLLLKVGSNPKLLLDR